jgi:hypothetical protein
MPALSVIEFGEQPRCHDAVDDLQELIVIGGVVRKDPEWDLAARDIVVATGAAHVVESLSEHVADVNPWIG